MTTRIEFADMVSVYNGWKPSLVLEQVLTVMAVGEGSQALFNPIDTILYLPGATPYNSFSTGPPEPPWNGKLHVWNFVSLEQGVQATAETYAGWPKVVAALQSGASVQGVIDAVNASDGVQEGYYTQYVIPVLERWSWEGYVLIAGTEPPPPLPEEAQKMLVGRVTGTEGPCYLIQPGPTAAHIFVKRVLSAAQLAQASELGMTLRDYTAADLEAIPNI